MRLAKAQEAPHGSAFTVRPHGKAPRACRRITVLVLAYRAPCHFWARRFYMKRNRLDTRRSRPRISRLARVRDYYYMRIDSADVSIVAVLPASRVSSLAEFTMRRVFAIIYIARHFAVIERIQKARAGASILKRNSHECRTCQAGQD